MSTENFRLTSTHFPIASGSNLAEMSLSVGAGSKLRIDMVLFHAEFQIMRSNFSVASEVYLLF